MVKCISVASNTLYVEVVSLSSGNDSHHVACVTGSLVLRGSWNSNSKQ